MGREGRWLTAVALAGTIASVMAAAMLWVIMTRPALVVASIGAWLAGPK